jgi:hypothetical protein
VLKLAWGSSNSFFFAVLCILSLEFVRTYCVEGR